MLAETVDVVIGVDTHRDAHAFAVVAAATGGVVGEFVAPATPAGYRRALREAARLGRGPRAWAVEGAGAYGAGLRRHLVARGEQVVEIDRPERRGERHAQKSDALDAVRAARTALSRERLCAPRADGRREALRVLMVARAGAAKTRGDAIRQLRALLVSAPDGVREPLRRLGRTTLLRRCAALRPAACADPVRAATAAALRAISRRALQATAEMREHERAILAHVRALAPELLDEAGVGPVSAAQLVISWSHPGRLRGEAAFARLAGAAPIPASSGQVVRHRLDRGGDRQLNRALHTILVARRRHDPATQRYIERRQGEGKSAREAVRCLKRYLARHLFRVLEATAPAAA
jgi:transposase